MLMFFNRKEELSIDHRPWTIDHRGSMVVSDSLYKGAGLQVKSEPDEVMRSKEIKRLIFYGFQQELVTNSKKVIESRWFRVWIFLLILYSTTFQVQAQSDSLNKKRLAWVGGVTAASYAGIMITLDQAWYANYPRSSFHLINDNAEWLQMDKIGHFWSAQSYALAGMEVMKWTGIPRKKAIWIGGIGALFFQTSLEVFDGFSAQWGASPGDMAANTLGAAMVVGQELAWDEQRFQLKMSFHPTNYAPLRPNLLGENFPSRMLKDYNGQTYWLSVNPWSFAKGSDWPKWLNISFGYGADGMLGGHGNTWTDATGVLHDYSSVKRQRQLYLSLDIDLQRLPINNPILKQLAKVANIIKIPAPTLMYQEGGKWQFYPLYF